MRKLVGYGIALCAFSCVTENNYTELFTTDPEQVYKRIEALDDPIEKMRIVDELSTAYPGKTTKLCELLDSSAQYFCVEQNRRPHLWMHTKQSTNSEQAQSMMEMSTLEHPAPIDCQDSRCLQEKALHKARVGDTKGVVAICAQDKTEILQQECVFATAESLVQWKGYLGYPIGVELCQSAGQFADNCQQHILQQMAKHAPDADSVSDWKNILSADAAVSSVWSFRNKGIEMQYRHRLWSEALGFAFAGADEIVGNVLDVVPLEFQAHVYSAVAWRLFQLEEPAKNDLRAWTTYIETALQQRNHKAESLDQQRKFRAASNLWKENGGENGTVYLATSQRLHHPNAHYDIEISILEAVARHPPVAISILEQGLLEDEPLVRGSAQRLLEALRDSP